MKLVNWCSSITTSSLLSRPTLYPIMVVQSFWSIKIATKYITQLSLFFPFFPLKPTVITGAAGGGGRGMLQSIGRGTRDQIANIRWIIRKAREFQKKYPFMLSWIRQSLWLCGSQQTMENSYRDGNTRSLYLPPEKSVCRSETSIRTGSPLMVLFSEE